MVKKLLGIDLIRFCIVGAAGFLINLGLLALFYKQLDVPIFIAQLIASEVALFHNFAMHHNWTYRGRRTEAKGLWQYVVEFHATGWMAILGSALIVSLCVRLLHFDYLLALAVSSVIALAWNFAWTRYYIWSSEESDPS